MRRIVILICIVLSFNSCDKLDNYSQNKDDFDGVTIYKVDKNHMLKEIGQLFMKSNKDVSISKGYSFENNKKFHYLNINLNEGSVNNLSDSTVVSLGNKALHILENEIINFKEYKRADVIFSSRIKHDETSIVNKKIVRIKSTESKL
ncbi:hypothetical protein [Nonlabens sp. Asnod2-A12]|uniref:hypothetical protein n=1 Tax=Nonlabens sp. Asnod2-A12 TaxID=3160578 RepID=UPI00386F7D19